MTPERLALEIDENRELVRRLTKRVEALENRLDALTAGPSDVPPELAEARAERDKAKARASELEQGLASLQELLTVVEAERDRFQAQLEAAGIKPAEAPKDSAAPEPPEFIDQGTLFHSSGG